MALTWPYGDGSGMSGWQTAKLQRLADIQFVDDGLSLSSGTLSAAQILGDFASVEAGPNASKAYSIGQYLVWNGKLYRVTAAIAQGNALNVGGNIALTTVGAEISSLNTDLFPHAVSTGISGINAYKSGNFVSLSISGVQFTATQAGWYDIGTLPQGLIPKLYFRSTGYDNAEVLYEKCNVVPFLINNAGVISVYAFSDNLSVAFHAYASYIAA